MMRNPLRVRFIREVVLLGGTQVAQAAAALVAGILVARALGPEGRGTLSVLISLGSITVILTSLGVHTSGVYFLARASSERDSVISNNLLWGAVGGALAALVLTSVVLVFSDQLLNGISFSLFLVYLLAVPCNYFTEFARRIELGLGHVRAYNLPEVIGGVGLISGTVVALLVFGSEIVPLLVLRVLIEAVAAATLLMLIHRNAQFRFRPSSAVLRKQVQYGIRNYSGSLLWIVLLQGDLLLCNYFLGSGPTGVYSVAVSLGLPVTLLAGVVGALTFQRVSADANRSSRVANTNRTMRLLVPLLALSLLIVGGSAQLIVPLVYGADFASASGALVILLPGLFALTLETVLMNFLAGEGAPPIVYVAPAAGLIINIAANIVVIPTMGIDGAALTSSVAYVFVFVAVFAFYLRSTGCRAREVLVARMSDVTAVWRASASPAQTRRGKV